MGDISIRLDTSQFEQRLQFASREGLNAMRRAVDKAARTARKEALRKMAADIGAPASKFRSAVPLVRASTASNISASWTVSKKRLSLLELSGTKFVPVLSALRGKASGSTFRVTGGGSASLNLPKAFILTASNGARLLMIRNGKGRAAIKPLYAGMPNTTMSQDDGAPRREWQKVAERELSLNLGAELQRAFNGLSGPSPSAMGGE